MLIETHIIQNFAPSNLNRDDTNAPKECEFGGVRRARISSQCLKRAMRMAPVFAKTTQVPLGMRTKYASRVIGEYLKAKVKPDDEINQAIPLMLEAYLSKLDSKAKNEPKTAVLLYLSPSEVKKISEAMLENRDALLEKEKKGKDAAEAIAKQLTRSASGITSAPDIALFGRMMAEKPDLSLDAACQVAHAISTHRTTFEMDYFTAVDDLNQKEETGAGMLGFVAFNSACFYRYANIHWEQLVKNLAGDEALAKKTVEAFLRAAAEAVPSGKQTSFAANNPPSFLLATARESNTGWSLANAFEQSVRYEADGGYVAPSILALDRYWGRLQSMYPGDGIKAAAAVCLDGKDVLDHLAGYATGNLEGLVQTITAVLTA